MRADWNDPYSFFNPKYAVSDENGNLQRTITGTAGIFLGIWYAAETNLDKGIFLTPSLQDNHHSCHILIRGNGHHCRNSRRE
jgi:acetoin utilization deacetylase AcuC-like enzyme